MTKLIKNCYYNRTGEKKVNCYILNIPKKVVEEAGIKPEDEVKMEVEDGKIIIKKD